MRKVHGIPPLTVSRHCYETRFILSVVLLASCNVSPLQQSESTDQVQM
ncbi:MAG: hypothetical protein ABI778_05145 [Ignavibacteriota bacterium]